MARAISGLEKDTEIKNLLINCKNESRNDKYLGFISPSFQQDIDNLINNKQWNSDLDTLPYILSDVLGISLTSYCSHCS